MRFVQLLSLAEVLFGLPCVLSLLVFVTFISGPSVLLSFGVAGAVAIVVRSLLARFLRFSFCLFDVLRRFVIVVVLFWSFVSVWLYGCICETGSLAYCFILLLATLL